MKFKTREEKALLIRTKSEKWSKWLLKNKENSKTHRKPSWEETVISEDLRKLLKMREEKVCSMNKELDNLKNNLKQKLTKSELTMKNTLQLKKAMNYQLTKYKNWSNSCKEKEEQQWPKISMQTEKFNKCKDKTDNSKTDSKEERVIWTNTKVKIKS